MTNSTNSMWSQWLIPWVKTYIRALYICFEMMCQQIVYLTHSSRNDHGTTFAQMGGNGANLGIRVLRPPKVSLAKTEDSVQSLVTRPRLQDPWTGTQLSTRDWDHFGKLVLSCAPPVSTLWFQFHRPPQVQPPNSGCSDYLFMTNTSLLHLDMWAYDCLGVCAQLRHTALCCAPPLGGWFWVPSGESCQDWLSVPLTRDPNHPSGPPKSEGGMGEGTLGPISPFSPVPLRGPFPPPVQTHAIPPKPHIWQKWTLPLNTVSNGGSKEPTHVFRGPWEVGVGRCPNLLQSHGHFSRTSTGPGQRNIGPMKKWRPPS